MSNVSTFWLGWGHNFVNTNMQVVKLPYNVDIAERTFFNCSMLQIIEFGRSQTTAVTIGHEAFYNVRLGTAYMHRTLANNPTFQLPQSATANMLKVAY